MASRLNPYIIFDGNARQAMEFYKGVFGGELTMNYQTLGNAVPHLHTHLVPRFAQDPAPGRPLPFPEGDRPTLPDATLRRDASALRSLI